MADAASTAAPPREESVGVAKNDKSGAGSGTDAAAGTSTTGPDAGAAGAAAKKIRTKNPGRVPIILHSQMQMAGGSDDKSGSAKPEWKTKRTKFLVSEMLNVSQFRRFVRSNLVPCSRTPQTQPQTQPQAQAKPPRVQLFVDSTGKELAQDALSVAELDRLYCDQDGFLYLRYQVKRSSRVVPVAEDGKEAEDGEEAEAAVPARDAPDSAALPADAAPADAAPADAAPAEVETDAAARALEAATTAVATAEEAEAETEAEAATAAAASPPPTTASQSSTLATEALDILAKLDAAVSEAPVQQNDTIGAGDEEVRSDVLAEPAAEAEKATEPPAKEAAHSAPNDADDVGEASEAEAPTSAASIEERPATVHDDDDLYKSPLFTPRKPSLVTESEAAASASVAAASRLDLERREHGREDRDCASEAAASEEDVGEAQEAAETAETAVRAHAEEGEDGETDAVAPGEFGRTVSISSRPTAAGTGSSTGTGTGAGDSIVFTGFESMVLSDDGAGSVGTAGTGILGMGLGTGTGTGIDSNTGVGSGAGQSAILSGLASGASTGSGGSGGGSLSNSNTSSGTGAESTSGWPSLSRESTLGDSSILTAANSNSNASATLGVGLGRDLRDLAGTPGVPGVASAAAHTPVAPAQRSAFLSEVVAQQQQQIMSLQQQQVQAHVKAQAQAQAQELVHNRDGDGDRGRHGEARGDFGASAGAGPGAGANAGEASARAGEEDEEAVGWVEVDSEDLAFKHEGPPSSLAVGKAFLLDKLGKLELPGDRMAKINAKAASLGRFAASMMKGDTGAGAGAGAGADASYDADAEGAAGADEWTCVNFDGRDESFGAAFL